MLALIALADGFEEVEAVTIVDVLRRGGVQAELVSINGTTSVRGAHGVTMESDLRWEEIASRLDAYDAIVLPGGGEGTNRLKTDPRVLAAVREFDRTHRFVCAICAAPTVLAAAGLLAGRQATCYPSCAPELGDSYSEAPVVTDDNIITGSGPGTATIFSLVLLMHFTDESVARQVADGMLADF